MKQFVDQSVFLGGSVVSLLSEYLAKVETDWSKWRFFFCDERLVDFSDPESTYSQYKEKFIGKLPINEDQFIKINPKLTGNLCFVLSDSFIVST